MIFTAVPPEQVHAIWPQVRKVIEKSVATGGKKFHVDDLYHLSQKGDYGFWVVIDDTDEIIAAVTTRVIAYPNRRALALDWVGGSRMVEWIDLVLDTLSQYGRDNNCQHMEGYGREAWGRWLGRRGWKPAYICYEAEL